MYKTKQTGKPAFFLQMRTVTSPLSGGKVLALYDALNCASESLLERLCTTFFLRINYGCCEGEFPVRNLDESFCTGV